jgi:peptide/nickel transport system ATP-binding protein
LPDPVALSAPGPVPEPGSVPASATLPDGGTRGDRAVPVIELRDLRKEYPLGRRLLPGRAVKTVKAVSGVSLQVHAGETFGLVGESGCGKSTLGRMAVALEDASDGAVLLQGSELAGMSRAELRRRRRDLQLMFQDSFDSLDPHLTIAESLAEPLEIQRFGSKDDRTERVGELLDEIGLPRSAAKRYPHELSGGQRQRVGLARALALNPAVIVADEPVSALDVSIRSQILNLMRRLQRRHGTTYIVISHDLTVVRYIADRIGVMYLGVLVETGTSEEVYDSPAHPYTAGLIAAIPVPDPQAGGTAERELVRGELPSPVDPPSGCRFRTRCPLAQDRCAEVEPILRSFGGSHQAACHFPLIDPSTGPTSI